MPIKPEDKISATLCGAIFAGNLDCPIIRISNFLWEVIKMRYYYPAVFEPAEEGGYVLQVPDVPGCITQGDDVNEAMFMVQDAIGLMLDEVDEKDYPKPSNIKEIDLSGYEPGSFVSFVCFDKEEYDRSIAEESNEDDA